MPFDIVYQIVRRRWAVVAISITLLFIVLAGEVWAGDEYLEVWAGHQEATLEQQAAAIQESAKKAQAALEEARSVLELAKELKDEEAAAIAQEAISIASEALSKAQAKGRRVQARMIAVEKVCRWGSDTKKVRTHVGVASVIRGDVRMKTVRGWQSFDGSISLKAGDEVRTGPDGFAELVFTGGSTVVLDANSGFRVAELDGTATVFNNIKGKLLLDYKCLKLIEKRVNCRHLRILRPGAIVAVRGTDFQIEARLDGSTVVTVINGVVEITPSKGGETTPIIAGHRAIITQKGHIERLTAFDPPSIDHWWEETLQ